MPECLKSPRGESETGNVDLDAAESPEGHTTDRRAVMVDRLGSGGRDGGCVMNTTPEHRRE